MCFHTEINYVETSARKVGIVMQTVTRTGKILLGTLKEMETISAVVEEIAESIQTFTALVARHHVASVTLSTRASGEMADALASGASVRKDVGVQVPPRAPKKYWIYPPYCTLGKWKSPLRLFSS